TTLDQFTIAGASDGLVRVEPMPSLKRIADDRVGGTGNTNNDTTHPLFNGTSPTELNTFAAPFNLGDVTLFVNSRNELYSVDPFTGTLETDVTGIPGGN